MKNIVNVLGVLALIITLGAGIHMVSGDSSEENQIETIEKHEAWTKCTKYIDFTKNMEAAAAETLFRSFRKTENIQTLEKYSCSQNTAWRAYIAENVNTPIKILQFYSDDPSYIVRQYLSANRNLPQEIAKKMQNDEERVLFALARNPIVDIKILENIVENNFTSHVQESLAYNRGTSEAFKKILAEKITNLNALKILEKNPNTTEEVQKIIDIRRETQ